MDSPLDANVALPWDLPVFALPSRQGVFDHETRFQASARLFGSDSPTVRLNGSLYAISLGADGDDDALRLLREAEPVLRAQGDGAANHLAYNLAVQGAVGWQLAASRQDSAHAAEKLREALCLIRERDYACPADVARIVEHLATALVHAQRAQEALQALNTIAAELTQVFLDDRECFLAHLDIRSEVLENLCLPTELATPSQMERERCDALLGLLRAATGPDGDVTDAACLVRGITGVEPRFSGFIRLLMHEMLQ